VKNGTKHSYDESGERRIEGLRRELEESKRAREEKLQELRVCSEAAAGLTPEGKGIELVKAPVDSPEDSAIRKLPTEDAIRIRQSMLKASMERRRAGMEVLRRTMQRISSADGEHVAEGPLPGLA
jgi:hypothetical protein